MIPDSRAETLSRLSNEEFDLLVIGGGIFGATAVWEATQAGLKAALIEATDFGHGSSANSFKIIHGGIRYLQHVDIPRVLSSSRERSAFIRMAPHLAKPLPIMIPTYGLGTLGMPFMGAGCIAYDILTAFRNLGIKDPARKVPFTKFLSADQVKEEFPDIDDEGLTGACVFNDGRFYNPTRMVWAFAESAMIDGAAACNHLSMQSLLMEKNKVVGINAVDEIAKAPIEIRAKCVLNTAGPWAERLMEKSTGGKYKPEGVYSRDACFVIKRRFKSEYTIALQGESADPDALLAREKRHLFAAPWRDYTLIGVWHKVTGIKPEDVTVGKDELEIYVKEINSAYPTLDLTVDDILMWNAGLVPFGEEQSSEENLSYGKRSNLIDHAATEDIENLITLVGLRYTMARGESEKAIQMVLKKLGRPRCAMKSDFIPLHSAGFGDFEPHIVTLMEQSQGLLNEDCARSLAHNYGKFASRIVALMLADNSLAKVYPNSTVTAAEVEYVCEHEMVESFGDLIFRRTDLATGERPADTVLNELLAQLAERKGWSDSQAQEELEKVEKRFL